MNNRLPKFSQLSEIKQKAVRMRAEGEKLEVIYEAIGLPYRTIQDWILPSGSCAEEVEEYKSYLAEKQLETTEALQERAAKDAVEVWERLKALALTDDSTIPMHVVLGAIDSVLDRAGIARVTKTEGKHAITVTDEDRRKRFAEIAELQGDLEPIQLRRLAGGKE